MTVMPGEPGAWAYFDTSVLVKCYVAEHGTHDALNLTGRHAVLSSAIAPIEVTSALRRQQAAGGLTRRQCDRALLRVRADRAHWTLMELDSQVLTRAESVAGVAPVKTLDALHLASALVFQAETDLRPPFVTGDAQQRRAAEALGLNVVFVG
jgi:predicted nucleic acid-binding protein